VTAITPSAPIFISIARSAPTFVVAASDAVPIFVKLRATSAIETAILAVLKSANVARTSSTALFVPPSSLTRLLRSETTGEHLGCRPDGLVHVALDLAGLDQVGDPRRELAGVSRENGEERRADDVLCVRPDGREAPLDVRVVVGVAGGLRLERAQVRGRERVDRLRTDSRRERVLHRRDQAELERRDLLRCRIDGDA
jgi:hypothetical protein